ATYDDYAASTNPVHCRCSAVLVVGRLVSVVGKRGPVQLGVLCRARSSGVRSLRALFWLAPFSSSWPGALSREFLFHAHSGRAFAGHRFCRGVIVGVVTATGGVTPVQKRALCQPPNKQLQRSVIPNRGRGACAPFHHAHAPRWTRDHAAAELRRYAS